MLSLMQWDKIILYSHNDNECQIANFWFSLQHMYYTKQLAVNKTELVFDHEWPTGPVRWSKENLAQCTTHTILYMFNNIWKNSFHCYLKGILSFFSLCKKTINKWPLYGVVPQKKILILYLRMQIIRYNSLWCLIT